MEKKATAQTPTPDDDSNFPIEAMPDPVDEFYINLARVYPSKNNKPYQLLENGVPINHYKEVLGQLYEQKIVNEIDRQIHTLHQPYRLFKVRITDKWSGPVVMVTPLRIKPET